MRPIPARPPLAVAAVLLALWSPLHGPAGPALAQGTKAPAPAVGASDGLPTPPSAESRAAEARAAWQAASAVAVRGPADVTLRDQAKLAIPQGFVFIPQDEATRLSRAMGNRPGPNFLGLVTSSSDADDWLVFINWTPEGYVRDDEAKDLDPATVLDSLREATAEGNKDRAARGFPELELSGWIQPPRYDASRHQLAWSLGVKAKDEAEQEGSVNLNTRALGRDGYLSLNLVTGRDAIERDRGAADILLAGLQYEAGKRYADFNASTDRVAEYGLAALIGVVAAKKLGLLAVIGIFVAKFAKVGLLALAGVGVVVGRLFRRKPSA